MNTNGQESVVEATITWTLQANGDELTGSLLREIPVAIEPMPATPIKGIRLKA